MSHNHIFKIWGRNMKQKNSFYHMINISTETMVFLKKILWWALYQPPSHPPILCSLSISASFWNCYGINFLLELLWAEALWFFPLNFSGSPSVSLQWGVAQRYPHPTSVRMVFGPSHFWTFPQHIQQNQKHCSGRLFGSTGNLNAT